MLRTRPSERASWAKVVAGNALVLALLLTLVFVGLEAYYRKVYDTTDVWNRSLVSKRWFERYWVRNADGVRDNVDYALQRSAGRRRITFLGDSFTAAHGVKDVEDRFVNRLRRGRPDWEVHAFARNGHNTVEQIEELRNITAAGYELDTVVLIYCHNDIDTFIPEFQALYRKVDVTPPSLGLLLKHSYAVDFYYQRWKLRGLALGSGVPYAELRNQAYAGRRFDDLAHNLELLAHDVWQRGARLGVATFPWMQMLLAGRDDLPMYTKLAEHWAGLGVPYLDLRATFAGIPPDELVVNRRDTHPNERAHALAAGAIRLFLDERVLPQPLGEPPVSSAEPS